MKEINKRGNVRVRVTDFERERQEVMNVQTTERVREDEGGGGGG